MKRNVEVKVKTDAKVYLIPKQELVFDQNGKPVIDEKYRVK